jgi:Predicted hydrolases or acyltransferases (alpha/beta hydrolase superfamily)
MITQILGIIRRQCSYEGGFGRHSAFWYHWIPSLAREYRVVRRDTRGHGKSSTPMPCDGYQYTLDTILSEIVDTLDQLGIEKVHFIGESTSGMLGEAFAAKFPNRLHSLTVISSPSYLPPEALTLFSFGHSSWPEACRRLGSGGWAEHLARVPGTLSAADPNYEAWWISQIAASSHDGLAGYAEFLSGLDARKFLPGISVPMLILAPAKSAATTLEEQLQIARQVRGSKIVVIHGAGHEVYIDKASDCLHAVQEFFLDIESGLVNNLA